MFQHVRPVIGADHHQPVVCQDYDPRADQVAREIAALIREHLPQVVVDHVGSTAVPGCAGRGVVDLMIPISDEELEVVTALLDRLGFQSQKPREPFPDDRPLRVGSWQHEGEEFRLHVHVIPANSPEVDEMRFFRTCLRSDPELLKLYVARKRAILAEGKTDPIEYYHAKDAFMKELFG